MSDNFPMSSAVEKLKPGICYLVGSQLVKANEALAVENKMLKDSTQSQKGNEGNCSVLHDEIRRLQAQNTALQNSLLGTTFDINNPCTYWIYSQFIVK